MVFQAKGGGGRNGGSGGRVAGQASLIQFVGDYETQGGAGVGGEVGAAGTMLLTDDYLGGHRTLRIYNQQGQGVGDSFQVVTEHHRSTASLDKG